MGLLQPAPEVCISGPQPFWHKGPVSWKTTAHVCCAACSDRLWPWGYGYQSIWSRELSVRFKSVHCSNFRNEEENIQLFWSCPTTSLSLCCYPSLQDFVRSKIREGMWIPWQPPSKTLHSIWPMNCSVCLGSIIWYVACLI